MQQNFVNSVKLRINHWISL